MAIRVVGRGEKLKADDVVGRYVFKDGIFQFPSFALGGMATSVSGSRVYFSREGILKDEEGFACIAGTGERVSEGYMSLSSVICTCDTAQEVNLILRTSLENQRRWRAAIQEMEGALVALHGVEVAPSPKP